MGECCVYDGVSCFLFTEDTVSFCTNAACNLVGSGAARTIFHVYILPGIAVYPVNGRFGISCE